MQTNKDSFDTSRIDRFIAQYDGNGDILKAYQDWARSPEATILKGKGFIAYPTRHRKYFQVQNNVKQQKDVDKLQANQVNINGVYPLKAFTAR